MSADYRCVGGIIGVSAELSAFRGNYRCVVVRKPCASSIEFAHVSFARSSMLSSCRAVGDRSVLIVQHPLQYIYIISLKSVFSKSAFARNSTSSKCIHIVSY